MNNSYSQYWHQKMHLRDKKIINVEVSSSLSISNTDENSSQFSYDKSENASDQPKYNEKSISVYIQSFVQPTISEVDSQTNYYEEIEREEQEEEEEKHLTVMRKFKGRRNKKIENGKMINKKVGNSKVKKYNNAIQNVSEYQFDEHQQAQQYQICEGSLQSQIRNIFSAYFIDQKISSKVFLEVRHILIAQIQEIISMAVNKNIMIKRSCSLLTAYDIAEIISGMGHKYRDKIVRTKIFSQMEGNFPISASQEGRKQLQNEIDGGEKCLRSKKFVKKSSKISKAQPKQ